ncbi:MAG: AMP-binding protein [Rhodopseudomonas palustris]|nr:AMP-binding protein [Rhodopseudomonas palustris]
MFNWALDWFDAELASHPIAATAPRCGSSRPPPARETKHSFAELSRRSNQVANFLRAQGLQRGDHLLLLLGNVVPLWETMLAAIKLGVVVIPATTLLTPEELRDRLERGAAQAGGGRRRTRSRSSMVLAVARCSASWSAAARCPAGLPFEQTAGLSRRPSCRTGATRPDDPMLLYFTSGTTAKPKLVRHTPAQLSGRRAVDACSGSGCSPATCISTSRRPAGPSTPGAASSRPGTPAPRVFVVQLSRASTPRRLLATCWSAAASPRYARRRPCGGMLIQEHAGRRGKVALREVLRRRRAAQPGSDRSGARSLGLTIRDGYGQTETTAHDRQSARASRSRSARWAGRCRATSIALTRCRRPAGRGGRDHAAARRRASRRPDAGLSGRGAARLPEPMRDGYYRTGDVALRDDDGYHHLRRPRRRRLQGLGLPHQPVRAGERADRARGGGRGRGGADARTRSGWPMPKAYRDPDLGP